MLPIVLFLASLLTLAAGRLHRRYGVLPSQDPFYAPPANITAYQRGDIVRYRLMPNNITALLPGIPANIGSTYQIFFRTSDIFGNGVGAVTTLWVPNGANADNTKLLSYQVPMDSPDPDCAPSFDLQNGYVFSPELEASLPSNLLPIICLNLGWYINLPDHEGLLGALNAGLIQGQTTLDSIRAVLRSGFITGINPSANVALWGYSGGSVPTEWAAELMPSYAPELNIKGIAFGGINPNKQIGVTTGNLPSPVVGVIVGGILGLSHAYPNLSNYLDEMLVPRTADTFRQQERSCSLIGNFTAFNYIPAYFRNGPFALNTPLVQSVYHWGTVWGLHGVPTVPLWVDQAIFNDVPIFSPNMYVSTMCRKGAVIHYAKGSKTDHNTEAIIGAPPAISWIRDRLNNVPAATKCVTTTITYSQVPQSETSLVGTAIYSALTSAYNHLS